METPGDHPEGLELLEQITRFHSSYVDEPDPKRFFDYLLGELLEVSGSEYGFIGEVFEGEGGAPYLKTHAITNIAWDEETRRFYEEHAPEGLEFLNLDTLFGHVLRTGEPLVSNTPESDPRAGGTPEGHPALRAFVGLPLLHKGQMIGMFGMANRAGGYSEEFLERLAPLWTTASTLLKAHINYREKQDAEQDRRVVLEQLQQAARMETVGQLAGGIAHDMNNLLIAILGNAELAQEAVASGSEDRALLLEDLEQILFAGKRAAALTNQLLAFSSRKVIQPRTLSLAGVVEEVSALLRRLIRENITIEVDLLPAVPPVEADASMMNQVILNLALNAKDAIDGSGVIQIRVEPRGEDHAALVVRDNGRGMDEEELARATEPFFTTKRSGSGTGLGLATVQRIVSQSGGELSIESTPGEGSTFTVLLPACDGEVEASVAQAEQPLSGNAETILVCEDDEVVLDFTRRALEGDGYTVLAALTAGAARELAEQSGEIDLLLTDVILPESSGPEVAKELQGLYPQAATVFMSGYTGLDAGRSLQRGADFLQKPFSKSALLGAIREALDAR